VTSNGCVNTSGRPSLSPGSCCETDHRRDDRRRFAPRGAEDDRAAGIAWLHTPRSQIALRDYLRAHPDAAARYGALKKQLADRFPDDIDSYVFGKTDFVLEILRRAGLTAEQINKIERDNRRP
jgi:hypothetical protein